MSNSKTPIADAKFLDMLNKACELYKVIGVPKVESPMWYQLQPAIDENEDDKETMTVRFKSSQCPVNFWFQVPAEEYVYIQYQYSEYYEHFRKMKYDFIRENHPTIWKELRG